MDTKQAEFVSALPLEQLITAANDTRREGTGPKLDVCGIVNAKSGACGEDCRFCAQSARYRTDIPEYPLKTKEELVAAARAAKDNGAERFGIVTSGNALTPSEIETIAAAIREIISDVGIKPCASLGALSADSFQVLKDAGLSRYHHNIETSERFYSSIVTTHNYSQRVDTIKTAKNAGLEVCSGGIIGMGESWQDRIDMARLLKELQVDSVPLNFLVPIKGTPLESVKPISALEALRTIALFRVILRDASIKIVAGRETVLKDYQLMMFMAGANGMMVGGYLTVTGRPVEDDRALINEVIELWSKE